MTDTKLDLDEMERVARDSGQWPLIIGSAKLLALLAEHKATKERLAEVTAETCDAHEMLDRYAAPRDDEGEGGGPLSLSGRIEAKVYADAVTAEAQLARAKEGLERIADGRTPPEQHGHYLAHRAAMKEARDTLKALEQE